MLDYKIWGKGTLVNSLPKASGQLLMDDLASGNQRASSMYLKHEMTSISGARLSWCHLWSMVKKQNSLYVNYIIVVDIKFNDFFCI